jgi:hypothetical protein
MKSDVDAALRVPLAPDAAQEQRLQALQVAFAEVCNTIAPMVAKTGVWSRVALHHMAYHGLREQFPALGSQMVCNAIYAVSRTCRWVFQSEGSRYHVSSFRGQALPRLHFSNQCPVYLDRNTFSLKDGRASLFTLDGRMRFQLDIGARAEALFHSAKLMEILLVRVQGRYTLTFNLQIGSATLDDEPHEAETVAKAETLAYLAVNGEPLALPTTLAHGRIPQASQATQATPASRRAVPLPTAGARPSDA